MLRCDLHVHTDRSDGMLPTEEVVHAARKGGLGVLSITDHDTLDAVAPAVAAAGEDLTVIPGVEISCGIDGASIHILAYFPRIPAPAFQAYIQERSEQRNHRILEGLVRLRNQGLDVAEEAVRKCARGRVLSRSHVARVLVSTGVVPDAPAAFQRHLSHQLGAFQPSTLAPAGAIETVHAAGGVAIWAHPPRDRVPRLLGPLVRMGLDGVEAIGRRGQAPGLAREVEGRPLLVTAGSDWHGAPTQPPLGSFSARASRIEPFLRRMGVTVPSDS